MNADYALRLWDEYLLWLASWLASSYDGLLHRRRWGKDFSSVNQNVGGNGNGGFGSDDRNSLAPAASAARTIAFATAT